MSAMLLLALALLLPLSECVHDVNINYAAVSASDTQFWTRDLPEEYRNVDFSSLVAANITSFDLKCAFFQLLKCPQIFE